MKLPEYARKWAEAKQLQDDTKERYAAHGFEKGMRYGLLVALALSDRIELWQRADIYFDVERYSAALRDILSGNGDIPEVQE